MTRRIAGIALATGLSLALAATAQADPSATPATTTAPAPTVAVQGGAQAPATGSAASGSAASGSAASGSAQTPAASPAANAATGTAGGDILDQLAEEYAVGAGGGQVSNLLKTTLKLRAMGFRPSKANLQEIAQAMDYRPNQMPLIGALKDTIAYQQKLKAQMEVLQQYQQSQAGGMGSGQSAPSMGQPSTGQPGMSVGTAPVDGAAPMMPSAPTP